MCEKDTDRPREFKRSRKPAHPMKREIKSEVKSHAESTMNELLSWYKYGKADRRDPDTMEGGLSISTLKENCAPKEKKTGESLSSLAVVMKKGRMDSSSVTEQAKIQICSPQITSSQIKIPAEQDVLSEQVTCAWCQKAGARRYSLHMGSELKSFCSEKCFAACRRANFKHNKARDRNGQDEDSPQQSKWKETSRQGIKVISESLVCDWCRHVCHTTEYLDFGESERRLNFCSPKCLNQYKVGVFYKESHAKQQGVETRTKSCETGRRLLGPESWNLPQGDLRPQVKTITRPTETTLASSIESRVASASPAFCVPVVHTSGPQNQKSLNLPSVTGVPVNIPNEMIHHSPAASSTEHQRNCSQPPALWKPPYSTASHGTLMNLHPTPTARGPPPPDSSIPKSMNFSHSQPLPTTAAVPGTPAWPVPPYLATHTPVPPFVPNSIISNHYIAMPQGSFSFTPLVPSPTLLVPYPIIVPLPVPVPIPIPFRARSTPQGNRDIVPGLPTGEDQSENLHAPSLADAGENQGGSEKKPTKDKTSEQRNFTQLTFTTAHEQGRANTDHSVKVGTPDVSWSMSLSPKGMCQSEVTDLTFGPGPEELDLPLLGKTRTSSSPMTPTVTLACERPSDRESRSQCNFDNTRLGNGNMGAEPSPATPCTINVTAPVSIRGVTFSEDAAVGEPEPPKENEWMALGTNARRDVPSSEGEDGGDRDESSSTDEEHPYTPAIQTGEKPGRRSTIRVTCVTAAEELGALELPPKRRCLRIRHLNK
ncbi:sine oculis-binding protein homolog [Scleropages formosus]|uniref:Sine oculis binding protein homolog (Drosophila) b n=1 Tax=Scleropages formosus TaxID=113540 RepID=A0A8C9R8U6_SCLFO|nr:sine oculis-binding protein homolog [Scleropages formosus]